MYQKQQIKNASSRTWRSLLVRTSSCPAYTAPIVNIRTRVSFRLTNEDQLRRSQCNRKPTVSQRAYLSSKPEARTILYRNAPETKVLATFRNTGDE